MSSQVKRLLRVVTASVALNVALSMFWFVPQAHMQAGTTVEITAPSDGEILRGDALIRGTAAGAAFSSADLSFAFIEDPTETWFRITELTVPVENAALWTWNTLEVSDGEYWLRLRLLSLDGTRQEATVRIQIRNYTGAIEPTATPAPTTQPAMQVDTPVVIQPSPTAALVVPRVTPTLMPMNPAAVTPAAILSGFWRGALAVLAASVLVSVIMLRRRT